MEAELPAVEVDCCLDVVDDVADADFGDEVLLPNLACRTYAFRSERAEQHLAVT
jgi:hypothetical protein